MNFQFENIILNFDNINYDSGCEAVIRSTPETSDPPEPGHLEYDVTGHIEYDNFNIVLTEDQCNQLIEHYDVDDKLIKRLEEKMVERLGK